MTKTAKMVLFVTIVIAILLLVPSISNAYELEVTKVSTEDELLDAIAAQKPAIQLEDNITLTKSSLEFNYDVIINGTGHTITGTDTIQGVSSPSNKTLIVANPGATVSIMNLTLKDSPKYGVQAYNGGSLVLSGVTITDCAYGGVLINGGTVTVNSLYLNYNGTDGNNGIEMDKGSSVTGTPTLIMNGTLATNQNVDVVRVLTEVEITNTDSTLSKVFVNNGQVYVADANNNIVASGAIEGGSVNTEAEKVVVTVVSDNNKVNVLVDKNSTISKDLVGDKVILANGQSIEGYYSDDTYSTEFDFNATLAANTSIYVKLATIENADSETTTPNDEEETVAEEVTEEGEKDETPKTGVANYIGIAAVVAVLSTIAVVNLRRKNS